MNEDCFARYLAVSIFEWYLSVISEGRITLVRVRRLRYARYGLPDIVTSWTQEILELRSTPVAENTGRELWVRGPDRHWHRYTIFADKIEAVEMFGMSEPRHLGQQTLPVGWMEGGEILLPLLSCFTHINDTKKIHDSLRDEYIQNENGGAVLKIGYSVIVTTNLANN
jgi:hypothetical protein